MWIPWKEDTDQDKREACSIDFKVEKFNLELFIKFKGKPNMKEIIDINKKLFEHFDLLKNLFKEAIIRSEKYPKVDFEAFFKIS